MSRVRDIVWLGVSDGRVVDVWTRRRADGMKVRRRTEVVHPVVTLQVHRGIWDRALEIAGGDARRIRVYSATKVEVVGP